MWFNGGMTTIQIPARSLQPGRLVRDPFGVERRIKSTETVSNAISPDGRSTLVHYEGGVAMAYSLASLVTVVVEPATDEEFKDL